MAKIKKANKKLLVVVFIVAIAILVAIAYFAFSNINEEPTINVRQDPTLSSNQLQNIAGTNILASGVFTDADAVHKGSGTAEIALVNDKPILLFKDFKTTVGPDLFVYLSPNAANQDLGDYASLGRIQKTEGDQAYSLPENYKDYKTVVVWCRAFSVTFTTAELVFK